MDQLLHEAMARHVDSGQIAGMLTLVARGDEVDVDTIGSAAFGDPEPIRRDAIFRIASLSKPIVAAAAMTMVDDGTLHLGLAIDDLIPELADRRVLRSVDAELDDTVAAERSITVEDLLRYRMGFGVVMEAPRTHPIQRAEDDLVLRSIAGPPWPPVDHDVDHWIAALGSLPLVHQPGEEWMYGTSGQVLGVLLARVAGADLGTVLRDRILDPLGMADTGFWVPPDHLGRLATLYEADSEAGELSVLDDPADSWWSRPPSFPDGSGMLVSTIDDYWAFVAMLRADGTGGSDGGQVLSEASVRLMTTDPLTTEEEVDGGVFFGEDSAWGLGMLVPASGHEGEPLPVGYGWDGGSGTTWRTNRAADTTGILFTQRTMTSPVAPPVFEDFWAGVNESLG